jgi:hypothetical protein
MIVKIDINNGTTSESIEINTDGRTTDQQTSEPQKSDIAQINIVNDRPEYTKYIRYSIYSITTLATVLSIIYMLKNLHII